jgi:hypothetical protein
MDEMMLALVGILDATKYETNVAAWIKKGGLWTGIEDPITEKVVIETLDLCRSTSKPQVIEPPGNDAFTTSSEPEVNTSTNAELSTDLQDIDNSTANEPPGLELDSTISNNLPKASTLPPTFPSQPLQDILARYRKSGSPPSHNHPPPPLGSPRGTKPQNPATEQTTSLPMWFDSPKIVGHWVTKGRETLERLGIDIEDGIKPINP